MKDGYRVIDADRHVIEPPSVWDSYLEAPYRGRVQGDGNIRRVDGVPYSTTDPLVDTWVRNAQFFGAKEAFNQVFADGVENKFDAASNLRAMDREGIDISVHFPTYGLYAIWTDELDARFAAAICRAYNNWMADFCGTDARRLKGVALIPLQDTAMAMEELRRARRLGMVGVMFRPNPLHGRRVDHDDYLPIYSLASELNTPILFHEGIATMLPQIGKDRTSPYGHHVACHSMEQMMACLQVVGDGLLERFPELKVGFFESGCGWVPFWLDRMDEHWEHEGVFGAPRMTRTAPSELFRRQCIISCEAGDSMVDTVVDKVGEDFVVLASDYPHPDAVAKFPDRVVGDLTGNKRLTDTSKRKILWDNPARFFGING